ncbi:hypothetical protein BJV74DRAFT_869424 [Russula compacta]|nr:hypothetical protein BJV74DRAFT_869424 [Russula compacta]
MHPFLALPVLSLVFGARAFSHRSREPVPHSLDVRGANDVCAVITVEGGIFPLPILSGSISISKFMPGVLVHE